MNFRKNYRNLLLTMFGSGLGVAVRYALILTFGRFISHDLIVLVINLTACTLAGYFLQYFKNRNSRKEQELRTFLFTGVLGGFSTLAALDLAVYLCTFSLKSFIYLVSNICLGLVLGLVANRLSGGVSENPTVANDLSDSISDDLKED